MKLVQKSVLAVLFKPKIGAANECDKLQKDPRIQFGPPGR